MYLCVTWLYVNCYGGTHLTVLNILQSIFHSKTAQLLFISLYFVVSFSIVALILIFYLIFLFFSYFAYIFHQRKFPVCKNKFKSKIFVICFKCCNVVFEFPLTHRAVLVLADLTVEEGKWIWFDFISMKALCSRSILTTSKGFLRAEMIISKNPFLWMDV